MACGRDVRFFMYALYNAANVNKLIIIIIHTFTFNRDLAALSTFLLFSSIPMNKTTEDEYGHSKNEMYHSKNI